MPQSSQPAIGASLRSRQRYFGVELIDWLVVGMLLLATLIYFAPYLFTGKSPIAYDLLTVVAPWRALGGVEIQNGMMSDILRLQLPWRSLYRDALLEGEMPFWNPYAFGGMPFFANPQSAVLYPPSLLLLIGSIDTGFVLFLGLHLFATGLAFYILLRRLEVWRPAALTGALAWMFCGTLTIWLMWMSIPTTITLVPWGLLAVDWVLTSGRWRAVGALALAVAMLILAGHTQFAYYGALTCAAYAIWRSWALGLSWPDLLRRWMLSAVGVGLGLVTTTVQLLPTLELVGHNTRAGTSVEVLMASAIPLRQLPSTLVPTLFGTTTHYWGAGNFVEFTSYVGLACTLFALFALLHPQLGKLKMLWFFSLLAIVSLHVGHGGWLNIPLSYLPGYTTFRAVQRVITMWNLAAAAIAAWGIEAIWLAQGWRRRVVGAVAALLTVGALVSLGGTNGLTAWVAQITNAPPTAQNLEIIAAGMRRSLWIGLGCGIVISVLLIARSDRHWHITRWTTVAPALLVAVEMVHFGRSYQPAVDVARATLTTPGMDWLHEHRAEGRIARLGSAILDSPLPANMGILLHVEDADGSDSFTLDSYNRLVSLVEQERYENARNLNALGNFIHAESLQSPLVNLLGIAFILSEQPRPDLGPPWVEAYTGADMTIYRNPQVLPLAFVVGAAEIQPTAEGQVAALSRPSFDPARQAILAKPPATPLDPQATGSARVLDRTLNTLELAVDVQATPEQAALLVIRQNQYPGWHATIDGEPAEIIPTDLSFGSIVVPAGSHTVELRFVPRRLYLYGAISLGALLVSLLLVCFPNLIRSDVTFRSHASALT